MDVQITVASKVPGASDKKTSKVIDTTGKTWFVYNNQFAQFQEGNSYLITKYKINDFKGSTYYMVEAFTPITGSRAASNGAAPQAIPPRFQSSADTTKIDEQRRMDIFVCGHWNNVMANPNVHPLELTKEEKAKQLEEIRWAWLTVMGPNRPSPISTSPTRMDQPPARDASLDDQIPF